MATARRLTRAGSLRAVLVTIAATVGSTVLLGILYGILGLWSDVATLKEKADFYHGKEWPPPLRCPG